MATMQLEEATEQYGEETAGHVMDRLVISVSPADTAEQVTSFIKDQFKSIGKAGTIFVTNEQSRPVGIFRPRDLIMARPEQAMSEIMSMDFPIINATADAEDAAQIVQGIGFMALPVVNGQGQLVGKISPKIRERIIAERQRKELLQMSSVSSDARTTDGFIQIIRGRLPWLLAGLIGATVAAFVIGSFEEELQKAAILAAFIPVVMSMAGNSGLQAAGVSVQALASGSIVPGDRLAIRLMRELCGALSNGAIAGSILAALIIGAATVFEIDDPVNLALAASLSLMTVTTLAAIVGASVPFGLNKFGIDPAAATGVFITTSNDVLGVLVYFMMADLFYF